MARLPRLMGRGRALEVLLSADDIHGDLAERYGYVNRSLPDAELDGFVDALAMRIASFDKQAIADTKRLVDVASLPPDAEIKPEWDAFIASLGRPASQKRIKALMERGFHRAGDVENRLGFHVGQRLTRIAAGCRKTDGTSDASRSTKELVHKEVLKQKDGANDPQSST